MASLNVSGQEVKHAPVLLTLISSPAPALGHTLHGQTSQSPRFLLARCQDCKKSAQSDHIFLFILSCCATFEKSLNLSEP